jgi:hypothetical protein
MPTYQIQKNGQVFQKTADTREEAIAAVELRIAGDTASPAPAPEQDETGIMARFNAFSDAAGTMLSNVGGTVVGSTYGLGKGIINAVQEGTYGTQAGVQTVRDTMGEVTDQFSKGDAYTPEGQAVLDKVGDVAKAVAEPIADWDRDARLLEPLAMIPGSPLAPAYRSMAVSQGLPTASRAAAGQVADGAKAVAAAPGAAGRAISERTFQPPANRRSVGSEGVELARERQATAQGLPVPLEGEAQLTRGQLTRQNDQLQRERELAKRNGTGVPLQVRYQNQQEAMNKNFDHMDSDIDADDYIDDMDQGSSVRGAVDDYRAERKRQKDDAYKAAEDAGQMSTVVMPEILKGAKLTEIFQQSWINKGIIKPNEAVFQEAKRLSIIDEQGNLKPVNASTLETFRKFVNQAYDVTTPNQAWQRRQFLNAIDKGMDSIDAGPEYRAARGIARDYYDEFDNSPLASGVGSKKRGTNVERIPDEKVASKVLSSSMEEIDQLRATLNATEAGQKQWRGIQAKFLQGIRDRAFGTQTDANGTALLTPAKFKTYVQGLDRSGKLDAILGTQKAQQIRDLVDVSDSIGTTPPGVVNHSNSASAIFNQLQSMAGIANPKGLLIKGLFDYAKDNAHVKKSLDGNGLLDYEVGK